MDAHATSAWRQSIPWVVLFTLGLPPILCLLALNAYVHDGSDLVRIMDRARRLGVPALVDSLTPSPAATITGLQQAEFQIGGLKDFDAIRSLPQGSYWDFLNHADRTHDLDRYRGTVLAWDEHTCMAVEAAIDALGEQPIVSTLQNFGSDSYARSAVQDFLVARLLSAAQGHLESCERRLARYLLTLDPRCISNYYQISGMHMLALRLGDLPSPQPETAALLLHLAAAQPAQMRTSAAYTFHLLYDTLRLGGLDSLRSMNVMVPRVESIPLVAAWDVRRWRGDLLSSWLDVCQGSAKFPATRPVSPRRGILAMGSEVDVATHSGFQSSEAARTMLLAHALAALLRHEPLPADPYSRDGQVLRTKMVEGRTVIYSVGYDGVDDGADRSKDLLLCAIAAPSAAGPAPAPSARMRP